MFVTRLDSSRLGVEATGAGLSVGRGSRVAEAGTQTDPPSEATADAASEACGWPSGDSLDGSRCGAADYARTEWVEPWHDRCDNALALRSRRYQQIHDFCDVSRSNFRGLQHFEFYIAVVSAESNFTSSSYHFFCVGCTCRTLEAHLSKIQHRVDPMSGGFRCDLSVICAYTHSGWLSLSMSGMLSYMMMAASCLATAFCRVGA
jgi:hypothetical protein